MAKDKKVKKSNNKFPLADLLSEENLNDAKKIVERIGKKILERGRTCQKSRGMKS